MEEFFNRYPRLALGFSGGVDSSYLLYAALQAGADVRPYYVKTPFQPEFETKEAMALAEHLGVQMEVIHLDVLRCAQIASNTKERCYYCKRTIFSAIKERAGDRTLIDGTNASDDLSLRPGIRALQELGVRSPLAECGLKKEQIRALSKQAGLGTWNKPAYACLATRIPTGTVITGQLLKRVEGAEEELRELGFSDFRVRLHGGAAKIQVKQHQMELVLKRREEILCRLQPYFDAVLLDLEAR